MKDKLYDLAPVSQQQWISFGAMLRDRRNAVKLSRLALAHRAQLCDATIKHIETARHPPSRATLIRLLEVPELHLTWADVPGPQEPPAQTQVIPAPSPSASGESKPDSAQFLMNLIGFDEIALPPGAPKTLRIFRERTRDGGHADDNHLKDALGSE